MNRRSFIQRLAGAVAALSMQFSKPEEIGAPTPKAKKEKAQQGSIIIQNLDSENSVYLSTDKAGRLRFAKLQPGEIPSFVEYYAHSPGSVRISVTGG